MDPAIATRKEGGLPLPPRWLGRSLGQCLIAWADHHDRTVGAVRSRRLGSLWLGRLDGLLADQPHGPILLRPEGGVAGYRRHVGDTGEPAEQDTVGIRGLAPQIGVPN